MKKLLKKIYIYIIPILLLCSCNLNIQSGTEKEPSNKPATDDNVINTEYEQYKLDLIGNNTIVGMNYEILGNAVRKLPNVSDEGSVEKYPEYFKQYTDDNNVSYSTEIRQKVIDENLALMPSSTTFNKMDSEGNLYLVTDGVEVPVQKKLYKHTASTTMYTNPNSSNRTSEQPSDYQQAVIKKINISTPKKVGNYITGLYCQPGEVIKLELSENDLRTTGGIIVHIGNKHTYNYYDTTSSRLQTMIAGYNRMPLIYQKYTLNEQTSYFGSYFGGPIYIEPVNANTSFSVTISGALEYLHYIDGLTSKDEFNRLSNSSVPYFDFEIYDSGPRFGGPRYAVNSLDYNNYYNVAKLWSSINEYSKLVPHGRNDNANINMTFDTWVVGASAWAFTGSDFCILPIEWMYGSLSYDSFMNNGYWGTIHEFNHHHQKFGCNGAANEVSNNVVNYMEYILFTRITEYRDYTPNHYKGLNSHDLIDYYNEYKDRTDTLNTENGYGLLVQNFGPLNILKVARNQNMDRLSNINSWYQYLCDTLEMDFTYVIENYWHFTLDTDTVNAIKAKNYPTYIPVGSFYASNFKFKNKSGELNSNNALPYAINKELTLDLANDINALQGFTVSINDVTDPTYGTLDYNPLNGKFIYSNSTTNVDSFDVYVTVSNGSISEDVVITISLKPENTAISVETYEVPENSYTDINAAVADKFSKATSYTLTQTTKQTISGIKKNTITHVTGSFISNVSGTYDLCYKGGRGSSYLRAGINTKNLEDIGYILINQSGYMFTETAHSNKEVQLNEGDIVYYEMYLLSTADNAFLTLGICESSNRTPSNVITLADSLFGSFDGNFRNYSNTVIPTDDYYKKYSASMYKENSTLNYEIVSTNFVPWDNNSTYALEHILDGTSSVAHSQRNITISQNNNIEFVVDFKQKETFNTIEFVSTYSKPSLPRHFTIYVSDDGTNWTEAKVVEEAIVSYRKYLTVTFDGQLSARYVKFNVTACDSNYFVVTNLKFYTYYDFDCKYVPQDNANYYGDITFNNYGYFGHSYTLNKDSLVDYKTNSSKVLFVLDIKSNNYEILLNDDDFTKYSLVKLNDGYSYLTIEGLSGTNRISIKNLNGSIDIISIAEK